jgi:hypothetical protein
MKVSKYAGIVALLLFGFGYGVLGCSSPEESDGGGDGGDGGDADDGKGGAKRGGSSGTGGRGGSSATGGRGGSGSGGRGGTGGMAAARGGSSGTGGMAASMGGMAASMGGMAMMPSGGLVGHWKFDGNAMDSSPNGNNGTVVAGGTDDAPAVGAPTYVAGKKNMAIQLNGTTEWVRVPDSDSLDSTGINNAVSLSMWIQLKGFDETGDDFNFMVSRHEVGTYHEHFGIGLLSGRPTVAVHFFFASGATNIPVDNTWRHVAMTYDGITQRLYLNGVEETFLDVGWPIAADETQLTIGGNQNVDLVKELWNGLIDDLQIYNKELSAGEVKAIYDAN